MTSIKGFWMPDFSTSKRSLFTGILEYVDWILRSMKPQGSPLNPDTKKSVVIISKAKKLNRLFIMSCFRLLIHSPIHPSIYKYIHSKNTQMAFGVVLGVIQWGEYHRTLYSRQNPKHPPSPPPHTHTVFPTLIPWTVNMKYTLIMFLETEGILQIQFRLLINQKRENLARHNIITWALWLVAKQEVRDLKQEDSTQHCWSDSGRGHVLRNAHSLQDLRAVWSWQPARKPGPQFYNLKELNYAKT